MKKRNLHIVEHKLLKVEDAITGTMTGRGDFIKTNGSSNDYSYYNDGSLKTDANKSITSITYNQYNLTKQVIVNGNTVDYVYDGNGTKLKKKTSSGTETIYEGGLILEKNSTSGDLEIYQIAHAEGRFSAALGYEYTYTDHLGNTRVMFNAQNVVGVITQNNAYDPWGLELNGIGLSSNYENHFKYNGKEEQLETAWMDYGARMYDAQIGRWGVVDLLAEKGRRWSPYVYTFDNPLRYTDPDGMWPWPSWSEVKKSATSAYNSTVNTVSSVSNTIVKETKAAAKATSNFVKENQNEIKNVAKAMQNSGDAMVVAGTAATISVVGAEVGVPAVVVGEAVNLAGTALEGVVDLFTADYGSAGQKVAFEVGGMVLEKVIDKAIPGSTTTEGLAKGAYELGKRIKAGSEEAGKTIYNQMGQLKLKIAEFTTEKVQEKK